MPRRYGQRGRMQAIIGDASLMAAHAGHPPSRGRLRRGSCYESQKPRLVQKGWDMLLQHAMRFRPYPSVSCGRRAARDLPTPSIRPRNPFCALEPPAFIRIFLAFAPRGVRPVIILSSTNPVRIPTKPDANQTKPKRKTGAEPSVNPPVSPP